MQNLSPIRVVKADDASNGSIGMLVDFPVEQIKIAAYQKNLNLERAHKIAEQFDIDRMRPIELSFRGGSYWCFDGQHRVNAYKIKGFRTIPAIIHFNLTYEQEAYLFARQQDNVGAIAIKHKWNALVEANDPETMDIVKICNDWGFTVLAKNNRGNNIKCVKLLRDFYREFGENVLATLLYTIGNAWEYKTHSTDHAILGGMYLLIKTYREKGFNFNRLGDRLAETTPNLILRDMEDEFHAIRGEQRRAAMQILKLYNKGLRSSQRMDVTLLK